MGKVNFNPNSIALNNGHFIGLPFSEEEARVVILPVPWDVTTSYSEGTSNAPENILKASLQLDLFDPEIDDAWKLGIYLRPSDKKWLKINQEMRPKAKRYISFLERGGELKYSQEMGDSLSEINQASEELNNFVHQESKKLIKQGKLPAVLGGEHSTSQGLMKALGEEYGSFGILQIDAHMDLREAYEGFRYSHASVFRNVVNEGHISHLVQVAIRDYCEEEVKFASSNGVEVFYDDDLKQGIFRGENWHGQCQNIISGLPEEVYISFDIDGLNPHLCPGTGTPVPGGLEFSESVYLIKELVKSGRKIIGFDLCEVGGYSEWDANVGARLLYKLCNWSGRSRGWV